MFIGEREEGHAVKTVSLDTEPPWKFFLLPGLGPKVPACLCFFSETFFTDFLPLK